METKKYSFDFCQHVNLHFYMKIDIPVDDHRKAEVKHLSLLQKLRHKSKVKSFNFKSLR